MTLNHQEIKHLTQAKLKQKIKQNKGWYFITLVQDLPNNRPYGFTLYNEPFVLLRTKNGGLVCYILLLDDEAKIRFDDLLRTKAQKSGATPRRRKTQGNAHQEESLGTL